MKKPSPRITISIIILVGFGYVIYAFLSSCDNYANFVKVKLDEFNSQNNCLTDDDCKFTTYYPCKIYSVHESFDYKEFYSNLGRTQPVTCPLAACAAEMFDPYKPVCKNNICTFIEK